MARNVIFFYSDGACLRNPGPGGWGVLFCAGDSEVIEAAGHLAHTTNNQMEIQGFIEGLTLALQYAGSDSLVTDLIGLTDSKYTVQGVTQWLSQWEKRGWTTLEGKQIANIDQWKALAELLPEIKRRFKFEARLIPGHQGIFGNERADALATAMASNAGVSLFKGTKREYEKLHGAEVTLAKAGIKKLHQAAYYLSYVEGKLERHKEWSQCEARVKGRAGAKFKKVFSTQEEENILKQWGVKP